MATFISKTEQLKRMEAALPLIKHAAELISEPANMAETRHIEDCYSHLTDDAIVELEMSIEELSIELDNEYEPRRKYRGSFGLMFDRDS